MRRLEYVHPERADSYITNIAQALIPYIETYYNINYTVVATMFLSQVVGYTVSAVLINKLHMHFGQLGIAIIAPACKVAAYVATCVHPPFPVIPIMFAIAGFGNGLEDGAWNAWIGGLEHPNESLGLVAIFAFLSGTLISRLLDSSMQLMASVLLLHP